MRQSATALIVGPLLVVGILLAALISGCARVETYELKVRLDDSLRMYAKALRWGNPQAAAALVRHRDGSAVQPGRGFPPGLQVTGVNVVPMQQSADAHETLVAVRIEYIDPDSLSVRTYEGAEIWWYDPDTHRWYLDGDLPDLGLPAR